MFDILSLVCLVVIFILLYAQGKAIKKQVTIADLQNDTQSAQNETIKLLHKRISSLEEKVGCLGE